MSNSRLHYKKTLGLINIVVVLLSAFAAAVTIHTVLPTKADQNWLTGWQYRKMITVNHARVSGNLANFPVLIDVTDQDLKLKAQTNGNDIAFTDNSSVKLDHEIESYDGNSGHLVAWVRVPSVSSTADTTLYMYYGNPSAGNQQNPTTVWDSSYAMVQHLGNNSSPVQYDSTTNHNDGSIGGGSPAPNSDVISAQIVLSGYEQPAFSNLLLDKDLNLIVDANNDTWLYTNENPGGGGGDSGWWRGYAYTMNVDNFSTGPRTLVKDYDPDGIWANPHNVWKIADDFYVMIYTVVLSGSGRGVVRAATCDSPNGTFSMVPGFEIDPDQAWEGSRIESDPGAVKISEDSQYIYYWILYSSLYAPGGDYSGWAKIRVDKTNKTVEFLGKHPNNPLTSVRLEGSGYSRMGGTYPTVKLNGKYLYYYQSSGGIARALSSDPLFFTVDEKALVGVPISGLNDYGAEKFEAFWRNGNLYLMYQAYPDSVDCWTYVRQLNTTMTVQEPEQGIIDGAFSAGPSHNIQFPINNLGNCLDGSSAVTIEGWINPSSLGVSHYDSPMFLEHIGQGNQLGLGVYVAGDSSNKIAIGGRSQQNPSDSYQELMGSPVSTDEWTFVTGVWDFTNKSMCIYENGALDSSQSSVAFGKNIFTQGSATDNDWIGAYSEAGTYFNGLIDEVRVSTVGRSAAWISTEYNNQVSPSTFYTVWTEETPTSGPGWPFQPAAPILVITNNSLGSFDAYTGEILKAEGIMEFQTVDIGSVSADFLDNFDIVILSPISLSSSEVTMFQNYVSAGGNLIGFKPDSQLASVFGVTPTGTTTSEGYIKVDNTTDMGNGVVGDTMQFHGTADNYNVNGAVVIATLYSDASTATPYPAVATYGYGYGETVFFAYDLAKCTAYLRQGNPALANIETDGVPGLRPKDLFGLGWLNIGKIAIPQADEQMHILSNAIYRLNYLKKPLPRLWYFPNGDKTMLIMTADEEGATTAQANQEIADIKAQGGNCSIYLTGWESNSTVQNWTSQGIDVGYHMFYGGAPSGYQAWYDYYTNIVNSFESNYGFGPSTVRHHCIVWMGYVDPAKIEAAHGVHLDLNCYHGDMNGSTMPNGWFTGSGIPMKFIDENGTVIDSYQVNTEFADETQIGSMHLTGAQAAADAAVMFNMSSNGFYSAFAANFHPPNWGGENKAFGLDMMAYANSYGVPIWSAKQLLDFTDAKNKATFENITYGSGQLGFVLNIPAGADDLTTMIPYLAENRILDNITVNSTVQPFSTETVDGIKYACFTTNSAGNYNVTVSYRLDTTPPEITIVYPVNGTILPANATSVDISITTDKPSDCRYSTTNPDFDYASEGIDFTSGQGTLMHSFTLSNLQMNRTYTLYYKAKDTAGNIDNASTTHTFSVFLNDKTPPDWTNQGQSTSLINQGGSPVLSAQGRDEYGLRYAVLSTNETGNWKNCTWWDTSWPYRKPVTITENSGSTLSNFQVQLTVNYASSKMKSDFSDLRFTAGDALTPVPYWIESYVASTSAVVWVNVPTIPASGTTTVYMYYGNPSATDASNASATMEFQDSFPGNTMDTSKWTVNAVNQITYGVNNYFRFQDATRGGTSYWVYDGTDTGSQIQAKVTLPSQFVIEFTSQLNETATNQYGEGSVGLVAGDNTVIGMAGPGDWDGNYPMRNVVTENAASTLGSGVTQGTTYKTLAYKHVTSTDTSSWKIVCNGSALIFYDSDGFFASANISSAVSKLALVGGTYLTNPYLAFIQINSLAVRKYASVDPSSVVGAEEAYGMSGTTGPWWSTSWAYREPLTVIEHSGSSLSNYPVQLTVNYASSKMKSDFSDLRFTAGDALTPVPYWIESYVASTSAVVWVNVPTIPASSVTTVYMYYGNPSATDASNGDKTFSFFDDFGGASINQTKWGSSGNVTEANGYMQLGPGPDSWAWQNTTNYPKFSSGYALRSRSLVSQTGSGTFAYIGFAAGTPGTSYAMAPHSSSYYITDNAGTRQNSGDATGFTSYAVYDIDWTASSVKYYQNGVLKATHTNSPTVSMGAYLEAYIPTGIYARCDWLLIRKCATQEPSTSIGSEEAYAPPVMHYYHGSPKNMGDVAGAWVWSNFTWNNPTIQSGTTVAWKIWYEDASGNWNSTDTMTFLVYNLTSAPIIESCDMAGTAKNQFNFGETIYVNGNGYPPYARSYSMYVVNDLGTWIDGMSVPPRVSGTVNAVSVDSSGTILSTSVGSQLTPGEYDILVDVNGNGKYDVGVDALYRVFLVTGGTPTLTFNQDSKTCSMYGETFTVQINISNAYDVEDFRFEIHYNATLLDVSAVSWTAFGTGSYTADEINGILTGYTYGSQLSGNLTLITITFNATCCHMWKAVPSWINDLAGAIFVQWANLSYPSGSDLSYVRGGTQNQINAGPDVAYTFSPIQGDVNNDGVVDITDLRTVAAYYDVKQGDPLWSAASAYDLNGNGVIDLYDLVIVAANFGFTYP